jgi:Family of unknown function (DUF6573)
MNENDSSGTWQDAEVISTYSREQALEDGVLVDVSAMAKEAGFKVPVAVTSALWSLLEPSSMDEGLGQSVEGRLWDVLAVLRASARGGDAVVFDVLVASGEGTHPVRLKGIIGPGDHAEPVITIMLPDED